MQVQTASVHISPVNATWEEKESTALHSTDVKEFHAILLSRNPRNWIRFMQWMLKVKIVPPEGVPVERASRGKRIDDATVSNRWVKTVLVNFNISKNTMLSASRSADAVLKVNFLIHADERWERLIIVTATPGSLTSFSIKPVKSLATCGRQLKKTALPDNKGSDRTTYYKHKEAGIKTFTSSLSVLKDTKKQDDSAETGALDPEKQTVIHPVICKWH